MFREGLTIIVLAAAATSALAETYPTRPIQFVVPFTAGNVVDINARAFADAFNGEIGGTVVVVNRDGAAGMIAMAAVANAAPDGYTLFFGPNGQLTLQPHLRKKLPYRVEQVVPICMTFETPFAVVVRTDSPQKTFADLIEAARKAPGKISYGLSGIGSVPHLLFHMVAVRAKTDFNVVAYRNYSLLVPDITAGRTDFGVMAFGSFQSPPMKMLAVLRERRHPRYPDVPTTTELGFPAETAAFGGLYAPAGTPKPVLDKIEGACERALKAPTVRKVLEDTGAVTEFEGREGFASRLAADSKIKAEAVRLLQLEVQ
ncbi:MAG: tripartite tricarboxylate transporter substrate binding protein [Alphaproteobacteria bacterium]